MMSRKLSMYLGLFACMFFLICAAQAQTVAGSISGLVTDSSGAAITDATVTVTDIDRSVVFKGTSNESGFYLVSPVPPGRYRIEAEKSGFRRFVIETYPIATQQKAGVDIRLDVGAVSESVTVSSSAQLVETTTATLSGVVENKRIIDLPLNGRNVYGLAALTPGVFGMSPAARQRRRRRRLRVHRPLHRQRRARFEQRHHDGRRSRHHELQHRQHERQ